MFLKIRALLRKWLGPASDQNNAAARRKQLDADAAIGHADDTIADYANGSPPHLVAYDENLLERSRTQWQFGDWASLARLERETLQHHPDRAKLALLAASGHQALGNVAEARQFTRLALDWGCSRKLVSQILIAGVHNTLARASAITGNQQRSLAHFESAVATVNPGIEHRLIARARAREETQRLGLSFELPGILNIPEAQPAVSLHGDTRLDSRFGGTAATAEHGVGPKN